MFLSVDMLTWGFKFIRNRLQAIEKRELRKIARIARLETERCRAKAGADKLNELVV